MKLLELFYPIMEGRSQFVAQYSSKLAKTMGLSESTVEDIYLAGLLHDIGLMGVPKEILNKPAPLTEEEYDRVKEHPVLAYTILRESKLLEKVAKIVRHHHERYDGKGYPDGLKGEEIPLESRIITVVDVWDTMLTDRPYAKALTFGEAVKELRDNSGTQFDPKVVKYFLKILKIE
jgi:polar amino acid transport system substrate-binding protein